MTAPTSTDHSADGGSKVGDAAQAAQQSGQAVAGSAADHAKDLAGSTSEKASEVVSEAGDKARDLLGETRDQVRSEAENRRGQAVSALRSLGDELDSMQEHDGDQGLATQLASRGSGYVQQTADWLDGREPSQILDDVRRFARRRPGTFLLGALLAGVVAGRLTRAAKAGAPDDGGARHATSPATPAPTPTASSAPRPVASSSAGGPGAPVVSHGDPFVTDDLTTPLPTRTDGTL